MSAGVAGAGSESDACQLCVCVCVCHGADDQHVPSSLELQRWSMMRYCFRNIQRVPCHSPASAACCVLLVARCGLVAW